MTIKGLYAVVDNSFSPKYSHIDLANDYLAGDCRILQLRMKNEGSQTLAWQESGLKSAPQWNDKVFETAKEIMKLKKRCDFTFIINDYVDVAGELNADGVHLGANDMDISSARTKLGTGKLIGYSSHSIEEALSAAQKGADYVAFGAIFPTKTKGPGHPVQGIKKLSELVARIDKPVVAIGGINRSNIDEVLQTGVSSIAMITGLTQAKNITTEVKYFVEKCSPGL